MLLTDLLGRIPSTRVNRGSEFDTTPERSLSFYLGVYHSPSSPPSSRILSSFAAVVLPLPEHSDRGTRRLLQTDSHGERETYREPISAWMVSLLHSH